MSILCKVDQSSHASLDDLHRHLRRLKVKQETYYHEFYPRQDRLTHEMIPYKDYDQYHSQDFLNKVNLKKWIKENKEEGLQWATAWLARRREEKSLVYPPSQVELRTLQCPSIPFYTSAGYRDLTTRLGFTQRYDNTNLVFNPLPADAVIIQDTREQSPLRFFVPTKQATLNVGDYSLAAPHDKGIRIERKSLNDFCGTCSGRRVARKSGDDSAYQRFQRELDRAQENGLHVVMMVESDINDAQRFNYLPQTKHVKASPEYILHNLRELLIRYPLTFQVVFVRGRVEMAEKVLRIFRLGNQARTTDLELAYEEGVL